MQQTTAFEYSNKNKKIRSKNQWGLVDVNSKQDKAEATKTQGKSNTVSSSDSKHC